MKLRHITISEGHWAIVSDYPNQTIKSNQPKKDALSFIVDKKSKERFKKKMGMDKIKTVDESLDKILNLLIEDAAEVTKRQSRMSWKPELDATLSMLKHIKSPVTDIVKDIADKIDNKKILKKFLDKAYDELYKSYQKYNKSLINPLSTPVDKEHSAIESLSASEEKLNELITKSTSEIYKELETEKTKYADPIPRETKQGPTLPKEHSDSWYVEEQFVIAKLNNYLLSEDIKQYKFKKDGQYRYIKEFEIEDLIAKSELPTQHKFSEDLFKQAIKSAYNNASQTEVEDIFINFKNTIGPVKDWPELILLSITKDDEQAFVTLPKTDELYNSLKAGDNEKIKEYINKFGAASGEDISGSTLEAVDRYIKLNGRWNIEDGRLRECILYEDNTSQKESTPEEIIEQIKRIVYDFGEEPEDITTKTENLTKSLIEKSPKEINELKPDNFIKLWKIIKNNNIIEFIYESRGKSPHNAKQKISELESEINSFNKNKNVEAIINILLLTNKLKSGPITVDVLNQKIKELIEYFIGQKGNEEKAKKIRKLIEEKLIGEKKFKKIKENVDKFIKKLLPLTANINTKNKTITFPKTQELTSSIINKLSSAGKIPAFISPHLKQYFNLNIGENIKDIKNSPELKSTTKLKTIVEVLLNEKDKIMDGIYSSSEIINDLNSKIEDFTKKINAPQKTKQNKSFEEIENKSFEEIDDEISTKIEKEEKGQVIKEDKKQAAIINVAANKLMSSFKNAILASTIELSKPIVKNFEEILSKEEPEETKEEPEEPEETKETKETKEPKETEEPETKETETAKGVEIEKIPQEGETTEEDIEIVDFDDEGEESEFE